MIKLYIIDGPDKGKFYHLAKDILFVGRGAGNDIRLKDPSVSTRHLRMQKRGETLFIEDMDSTNGTFLNGRKLIPFHLEEVEEGDLLTLGNTLASLDVELSISDTLVRQAPRALRDRVQNIKFEEELPKNRPMTPLRNLELIYKVSSVLMQSFNVSEILETFMAAVFECFRRIDRGAVLLVEPGAKEPKEIIARSRLGEDLPGITYSKTIVERVIREGKPVVIGDTSLIKSKNISDSIRAMSVKSVMCVPLTSKSLVKGVIYVDSLREPHGFRKEDLKLLVSLAGPTAIALENALIHSDLESLVERRTRSLKDAEKRLRTSEARFRAIFDNMESGVVVCRAEQDGRDFIIVDLNSAAEHIDKRKRDDLIGKRVGEAFPGFEKLGLLGVLGKVWHSDRAVHLSEQFYEDKWSKGWREFDIHRLPSGELVIIYRDITEKKRVEQEQKALQRRLLHSQKLESLGRLAGGVAHNFRNILQAVLGNAEYLQMVKQGDKDVERAVEAIVSSVDKGADLVHGLLHFSKLGQQVELVTIDLADVIRDTHRIIEKVFDKRIEIILELEEDLVIKGNQSLLSQVFMNLCNNARDAMRDGGTLRIKAFRSQGKVNIWISDTGHGMDQETVEKIFDPFFTLKEVGEGTGLGLSTVYGIVEEHKGTISVDSAPGKGTTFKLSFPLVKEAVKTSDLASFTQGLKLGQGEKVLVVDDEKTVLDSLVYMAERLGYRGKAAEGAIEALKIYKTWHPDVVLMDRNMPGMDGITCMKEILKADPEARVVILSGYEGNGPNGLDEKVRSLIKGYMTKPFGIDDLSNTLATILGDSTSKRVQ